MAGKNAFYAQSGGVSAVINASACGVIETARAQRRGIGKVLAGRNGIIGALTEDLIDTSHEPAAAIAALRHTPSGAFGSCRYKLKSLEDSRREYERLMEVFKAHDIGYFFYNGGGDSADTCLKVSQLAETHGRAAPGHPRAQDRRQRPARHRQLPGLRIGGQVHRGVHARGQLRRPLHGRHFHQGVRARGHGPPRGLDRRRGRLASDATTELPIVILFPEVHFDKERFLAKVDSLVKRIGFCTVVVSEGAKSADGKFLADQGLKRRLRPRAVGRRGPGGGGMVREGLGLKYHWAVADYLQRAARHVASKTDVDQAYAVGRAAVDMALAGKNSVMPTIVRTSIQPYAWEIGRGAPLRSRERGEEDARRLHHRRRLRHHRRLPRVPAPLIQGEDYPPYKDGLPDYVTLTNVPVQKRLPPFEI